MDYYNALIALGSGKNNNLYIKRLLVPFGDYTPFLKYFAYAFNLLNIPFSNTLPGKISQPPLIIDGIKILPSICYEIAFPEFIRSSDKTLGFLLTVTNDAWFGKSPAQAQHLQIAEMRAIELQRPLAFVSNNGITSIIAPDGKIEAAAPPYQVAVLNGRIQPVTGLTPWMRNGMDPLLFILICLVVTAIRSNKTHATKKNVVAESTEYSL